MSKLDLLLEAERRGLLDEPNAALLNEARQRGIVPAKTAALDVTPPAAQEAQPTELSWSAVPGKALSNVGDSAINLAKNVAQPFLDPVGTAKGLYEVGKGVASKAAGLVVDQDPETKAKNEAAANAVGQFFADRYGGVENVKKTMAEDPVGFLADLSVVLTGGGAIAARAPGVAGQVGNAVRATGRAVDPIANAGRAVVAGGRGAANVLGMTTGAGAMPIRTAFEAGRQGGQQATALTEAMRGQSPVRDVVDMAENAVSNMTRERGAAYRQGIQSTNASQASLSVNPINQIIQRGISETTFNGQAIYPDAVAALNRAQEIVDSIANMPNGRTPQAFDAMKRAVGGIVDGLPQGSNAQRVVREVYDRIGRQIRNMVPEYDDVMRGYAQASDQIDDVRRTFSINPNAAPDTTARKLLSVTRNNVNTNYGERARLMDVLAQQPGAETLPAAVSGHALSSATPRGLQGVAASGAGISALSQFGNPFTLATLPLFSPRLVGETVYLAGRAAGTVEEVAAALRVSPEVLRRGLTEAYVAGTVANNALMGDQTEAPPAPRNALMPR